MIARWLRKFRAHPPHSAPVLGSLDAYARWAASYPPHAHNALMRAEEQAMLDALPSLAGCVVLDLACGSGRYARVAVERGARMVIAADNSLPMLMAAPGLSRVLATMEHIPLRAGSVDVVLCGLAVGHLPRLELTLSGIARLLVPGGAALVSDVHPFLFLNGALRTFNSGGQTFAVEHYVHLYSAVHAAAAQAGLQIDVIAEPRARPEDAASAPQVPLAIVYRMIKA